MAVIVGLAPSHAHDQNGMTLADMVACHQVASRLDEVIIFRSTGPWAKRWIERGYPTKNFHVKGKSSDWGPQAGFVPYDGRFAIHVYPASAGSNPFKLIDNRQHVPLEVMVSNEVGTDRPMTGDYDLLAICPSWAQYGGQLGQEVVKPGHRAARTGRAAGGPLQRRRGTGQRPRSGAAHPRHEDVEPRRDDRRRLPQPPHRRPRRSAGRTW